MATVKRKVVKTATFSGVTLGILSVPNGAGLNIETDMAAAFGDEMFTQVPRVVASPDDLTLELIDEGDAPSVKVGDVQTFTISLVYWSGTAQEKTKSVTKECSVKAVAYGTAQVDGERKATITLTLAPVAGVDIATYSGTQANGGGN